MYRITRKKAAADRRFRAMRAAAARQRSAGPACDIDLTPPYQPPALRRVVIVIDYDLGEPRIETFRLRRTNRIDSYTIDHNGRKLPGRAGWANFCRRLSTHFTRLASPASY